MSSDVQTSLSPVLQERKTDQNTTKKRSFQRKSSESEMDHASAYEEIESREIVESGNASAKLFNRQWSASKKRKKIHLPNKFHLGK